MEVKIKKVNDTYARVIADKSTLMEIYNEFAFHVPNYKFMPKFKNTNWDGKIRYLNIYTGEIYLGLWIEVAMWCKKNGYEINIDPDLKPSKELNEEKLDKFTKYLELDPEKFTPRYFQKTGVITAINERRGLILSPTSSGKSLMIYLVSRYLNEMNSSKVLVVVPTVSLVRQMAGDFIEYNNDNEMDIHEISAGVDKDETNYYKFHIDDGSQYKFHCKEFIKIINSNISKKRAEDITIEDEIDDSWLQKQKDKQIL